MKSNYTDLRAAVLIGVLWVGPGMASTDPNAPPPTSAVQTTEHRGHAKEVLDARRAAKARLMRCRIHPEVCAQQEARKEPPLQRGPDGREH